jgi:hypothetical protein
MAQRQEGRSTHQRQIQEHANIRHGRVIRALARDNVAEAPAERLGKVLPGGDPVFAECSPGPRGKSPVWRVTRYSSILLSPLGLVPGASASSDRLARPS